MRSKPTAIAAATLVLLGTAAASGIANADPPAPPGPPPGPPPGGANMTIDHDGTYAVGTDISPGIYTSAGPVDDGTCYWKRLGSASSNDILDNSMSKKPQVVQIAPTDKAFKTDGCQPWQRNDAANPDPGKGNGAGNLLTILGPLINPSGGGQPPPKP